MVKVDKAEAFSGEKIDKTMMVEEDKKAEDPLASIGDVFSFIPNNKTKVYLAAGMLCAVISGCVLPAMAWLFSDSFTDLSATLQTDSKKELRAIAYQFMVLG